MPPLLSVRILATVLTLASAASAAPRFALDSAIASPDVPLIVLHDASAGLEAAIAPSAGGELASLRVRLADGWHELLYRARDYTPAIGARGRAAILWPAVGVNVAPGATGPAAHGSYDWQGHRYLLTTHGFARDHAFSIVGQGADADSAWIELLLRDQPDTHAAFPFGFEFHLTYRLHDGRLSLGHRIVAAAANTGPMPFSIGNHITFPLPLIAGSDPRATLVQSPSTLEWLKGLDQLATGRSAPLDYGRPVPVTALDAARARCLGGYAGDPWLILTDPSGFALRIDHHPETTPPDPVILFTLWGGVESGYLATEPWVGLQDSLNRHQGLIQLAPGASWSWRIDLTPLPATHL